MIQKRETQTPDQYSKWNFRYQTCDQIDQHLRRQTDHSSDTSPNPSVPKTWKDQKQYIQNNSREKILKEIQQTVISGKQYDNQETSNRTGYGSSSSFFYP